MDFAWVVDALRRGLKVTRKGWLLTNSTMHMKLVKDAESDCNVARIFCMGRQASTWCPTQEQLFKFTDWEEYVEPEKKSAAGYISLSSEKETRLPNNPSYDDDMQDSHGGKPVEAPDLDAETNKAIALVARNIAENLIELLRDPSMQRILQKRDVG